MSPLRQTIVVATTLFFLGCGRSEPNTERPNRHGPQPATAMEGNCGLLGDWEDIKRKELASPPIEWSCCNETDSFGQKGDFHNWYIETSFLVPEVYPTVNDWLDSAETEIDTIITNKPTGAQYRITGRKGTRSVWCSVKFIGNANWK